MKVRRQSSQIAESGSLLRTGLKDCLVVQRAAIFGSCAVGVITHFNGMAELDDSDPRLQKNKICPLAVNTNI